MHNVADANAHGKRKQRERAWTAPTKAVDSTIVHAAAIHDGNLKADIDAMLWLARRLTIEDMGRISVQIARAAAAKRPSELQRLLLAIVAYNAPEATP